MTLHDQLQKMLAGRSTLPERPQKEVKFFDSTKFESKYLKTRQNELQKYMRKLVEIPEVLASRIFLDFVQANSGM